MAKSRHQLEFGDFQTPRVLADAVCQRLVQDGCRPGGLVEPTCGEGALLLAALQHFPSVTRAVGLDIDAGYLSQVRRRLAGGAGCGHVRLIEADFFRTDWPDTLRTFPEPLLVIGNPPWVTNASLGSIGSRNLPGKSNFQGHLGLDAITGKSNFDISEWMLIQLMEGLNGRSATLAMLCKTAITRRLLQYAGKRRLRVQAARLYEIDALASFGANVDACLFVCDFGSGSPVATVPVYSRLAASEPASRLGWRNGRLVANASAYDKWQHLVAVPAGDMARRQTVRTWRSGIKHDCATVMELREESGSLHNRLGERVEIEPQLVFPMLKSSDVACPRTRTPRAWMLVTQKSVGSQTDGIRENFPRTWNYLISHASRLDGRRSSIYRNRPRFSVFGVGDYTFAPFKVAISGFYKRLQFRVVGPHQGLPVVFDDTVYFLACQSRREADFLAELLNSEPASDFYSAFIFWDAKRPITVDVLSQLELRHVAAELGRLAEFDAYG